MKHIKIIMLSLVIISASTASITQAQNANDIISKVDNVLFAPKDYSCKMKIVITNKRGRKSVREAVSYQKGMDKNLFRFTSPASQAGISTLSLANDIMYLYLPAFGKERRISSSIKGQKFAGTDFSFEDLEMVQYSEKYSVKLIEDKDNSYILELIPLKKSEYSKLLAEVDKNNYCPIEIKYFDKKGNAIKLQKLKFKKEKYWYNYETTMYNLAEGTSTKIVKYDLKFDSGLSDDIFSVRYLKQF